MSLKTLVSCRGRSWAGSVVCKTVTISQIRSASRNSAAEQQVLLGPPCAKCNACAKCKELGAQIRGWCTFSRLQLTGEFCLRISIRWRSMVRCTFSRVRIFAGTPDSARAESGARADWRACTTHAFLLGHPTSCTFFRAKVVFAMTTMARSFTTHLTSFVVLRVRFGPDSLESGPNPGPGLTYLITWLASRARKIFVEKCQFSIAYIAPISWLAVLAAPPRLVLLKIFQSHFSRQPRDLRHSHHTVSEDCMFQSHIPHQYRDKSVLARNRM